MLQLQRPRKTSNASKSKMIKIMLKERKRNSRKVDLLKTKVSLSNINKDIFVNK